MTSDDLHRNAAPAETSFRCSMSAVACAARARLSAICASCLVTLDEGQPGEARETTIPTVSAERQVRWVRVALRLAGCTPPAVRSEAFSRERWPDPATFGRTEIAASQQEASVCCESAHLVRTANRVCVSRQRGLSRPRSPFRAPAGRAVRGEEIHSRLVGRQIAAFHVPENHRNDELVMLGRRL